MPTYIYIGLPCDLASKKSARRSLDVFPSLLFTQGNEQSRPRLSRVDSDAIYPEDNLLWCATIPYLQKKLPKLAAYTS